MKERKKLKDHKELVVWQKGINLVDLIYENAKSFPRNELFELSNQMKRSAVSVPSNIAEGFNRQHTKEYIQFIYISIGSCAELETQVIIARRRSHLSHEKFHKLVTLLTEIRKMLFGLVRSLS